MRQGGLFFWGREKASDGGLSDAFDADHALVMVLLFPIRGLSDHLRDFLGHPR